MSADLLIVLEPTMHIVAQHADAYAQMNGGLASTFRWQRYFSNRKRLWGTTQSSLTNLPSRSLELNAPRRRYLGYPSGMMTVSRHIDIGYLRLQSCSSPCASRLQLHAVSTSHRGCSMCVTTNSWYAGSACGSGISADTASSMWRDDRILSSKIKSMCACGCQYGQKNALIKHCSITYQASRLPFNSEHVCSDLAENLHFYDILNEAAHF